MSWSPKKLLILTKTYPIPSKTHSEITCTAALTPEGRMWRIFPIPFRCLEKDAQFPKWTWIEALTRKAPNDRRPESHQVIFKDIKVEGPRIDTKNKWAERLDLLRPHIVDNFNELEQRRLTSKESLGIIRPVRMLDLIIEDEPEPEWTDLQIQYLQSEGLFTAEEAKSRPLLRKLPLRFYYVYECDGPNGVTTHRHKVTDWEMGATYWHFLRRYGEEGWKDKFLQKYKDEFSSKNLHFLMGNMFEAQDKWLIVGFFYPPK